MTSRQIISLLVALLLSARTQAQVTFYFNGITIKNSTTLYTGGGIQADAGTTILNDGTINLKGNWDNRSSSTIFNNTAGIVEFSGSTQTIGGTTATGFHDLFLTGGGNYTCTQSISTGGDGPVQDGLLALNNSILLLNSHNLSIKNKSPFAITRTTGFIDGETNPIAGLSKISWKTGATAVYTTYLFPFGNQSTNSYLPTSVIFNNAAYGVNGTIIAATYPTDPFQAPNNRPLPAGVPSINDFNGNENSAKILDRYWLIDFENYATPPSGTYFFSYRDSEHNTGNNTITESSLRAQRFTNTWSNILSGGIVYTSINLCAVTTITGLVNGIFALADLSSPLPIELLSFNATSTDAQTVDCQWTTATETNNDYFTIERGSDPGHFVEIGKVKGAGTITEPRYYSFEDTAPMDGLNYYRLKQTDFDGQFTYSKIVAIRFMKNINISVYPNPAKDEITIISKDKTTEPLKVQLLSPDGRIVLEKGVTPSEFSDIKLNVSTLARGTYFLWVNNNQGLQTVKLVLE